MKSSIFLLSLMILMVACQSSTKEPGTAGSGQKVLPEAISLDGRPLYPMPESPSAKAKKDSLLAIAQKNYDADPNDLDNIIWYGRRKAYLSLFKEAIGIFTKGMGIHPNAPELYRHRGHRYISIRHFDKAVLDFEKAAELAKGRPVEIEPDGLPNKLNIPLSSLQFNIWYHLGLAHYLKGDFEKAVAAYLECMNYSTNPDLLCATADWLYMSYRRLGKETEAAKVLEKITPDMNIIENSSYHKRLLMYKGLLEPKELLDFDNTSEEAKLDIVTQGYGVGNWFYYNGDTGKAKEVFKKVLDTGYWPAFGYIAAEADVVRLGFAEAK